MGRVRNSTIAIVVTVALVIAAAPVKALAVKFAPVQQV
jgi:hypothetical protein